MVQIRMDNQTDDDDDYTHFHRATVGISCYQQCHETYYLTLEKLALLHVLE